MGGAEIGDRGLIVDPFELREPLETERLLLRPFAPDDFDALFSYRSRADVAHYLMWEPEDHEQVKASLERKIHSTRFGAEGDFLALAIELRATGDLIGDVVLGFVSQEHRVAEIGYIVHPDHHGRGYATEACRPILRLAFEELGIHRVIGSLEARNVASARVLEKLGMRQEAHFVENELVKGEWQSEVVYAILEREWFAGPVGEGAER
ncbi:MAG: GNAT family N-acetyltransferase [Actinomycetota bacterium]